MAKILEQKIVYSNKRFVIEEASIADEHTNFTRLRLNRSDAAAVLLVNSETNKVILTRQFRYPVSTKTKGDILEIIAGVIDEGEDPVDAAIRETEEETGYRIRTANIRHLLTCFASPGYSSERYHIYFATAINADKVAKGGGLENENEYIQLEEIELGEFNLRVKNGDFEDAKTNLAALYMQVDGY